jgi:hypothetical protein
MQDAAVVLRDDHIKTDLQGIIPPRGRIQHFAFYLDIIPVVHESQIEIVEYIFRGRSDQGNS